MGDRFKPESVIGMGQNMHWFVVFQPKRPILLFCLLIITIFLSNRIRLFGLICLYSRLFGAIYWTTETVVFLVTNQKITW